LRPSSWDKNWCFQIKFTAHARNERVYVSHALYSAVNQLWWKSAWIYIIQSARRHFSPDGASCRFISLCWGRFACEQFKEETKTRPAIPADHARYVLGERATCLNSLNCDFGPIVCSVDMKELEREEKKEQLAFWMLLYRSSYRAHNYA
jgi:hypothetical protein